MNEIKTTQHSKNLAESVDILRDCVNDLASDVSELYDLDEDNFKKIASLFSGTESLKKRIDMLGHQIRSNRRRIIFGFVGVGGLLYVGKKIIDKYDERIKALEEKQDSEKKEENKESDG